LGFNFFKVTFHRLKPVIRMPKLGLSLLTAGPQLLHLF
jgi:hypothetical protein